MSFSETLKHLRKEKNITQKELGDAIGKSNRVISYYENEQENNNYPDTETLTKIAKFFNVSINYLLGIDNEKTTPKIELITRIIDLTTNKTISWINITNYTEIPFSNDYFPYWDELPDGDYVFDLMNFEKSFISKINQNYYCLISPTDGYNSNELCFFVFVGKEKNDLLEITNSEVNNMLDDLFEIIYGINNNNENKLINGLMNDLENIDLDNQPYINPDDIPF